MGTWQSDAMENIPAIIGFKHGSLQVLLRVPSLIPQLSIFILF